MTNHNTAIKKIRMKVSDKNMLIGAAHVQYFVLLAIRQQTLRNSNIECAKALNKAKTQIKNLWNNIDVKLEGLK